MYLHREQTVSLRRVFLLLADLAGAAGSLAAAAWLRFGWEEAGEYLVRHAASIPLVGLAVVVVFYIGGLYERDILTRRGALLRSGLAAVAAAMVLVIVILYARFQPIGRGVLAMSTALMAAVSLSARQLCRLAIREGLLARRALILGSRGGVGVVSAILTRSGGPVYHVQGVVGLGDLGRGELVGGWPVLGGPADLRALAESLRIEAVVLAPDPARDRPWLADLRALRLAGVEVLDVVSLGEQLAEEIPLEAIDDEWLMGASLNSSVIHIRRLKRALDVLLGGAALVALSPLMLLAAAAIWSPSRRPVLYRQTRSGLGGRPFVLVKFRTMREDAEADSGAVWSAPDDRRVTRVGRILRRWRIDELPQLVNVLRGDMSLVGPRPERPEFVDKLSAAIPFYRERLAVPPGLTGWAQIRYPYAGSLEAARRKLQFDLYYLKNMSFGLDLRILLRTLAAVLRGPTPPETEESPSNGSVTAASDQAHND